MSYEPRIIAFLCTWCSYTGADTAGIARMKSPANIRAIRVPCSGRVSPELIMRTFDQGADGVLVLGCHIGECHYDSGNHLTAKRLPILQALMTFAGLETERLHLDWVSASEGERFSRITTEFTEAVRKLGPVKWRAKVRKERGEARLVIEQEPSPTLEFQFSDIQSQYIDTTYQIRTKARELLSSGQAGCVIGYENGPRGRVRPTFIYKPEDVERLVWNQDCTHNLTAYLTQKLRPALPGKSVQPVAVVVKPCDSRAINVLMAENRMQRELVHVIGVQCDGIRQGAGMEPLNDGMPQARCLVCNEHTPLIYDSLVGKPIVPGIIPDDGQALPYHRLEALQNSAPAERMDFWLSQFDRCIRCYACRQACPMCDCPTCLYERDDSLWVGMGIGVNEKRAFHLGRAYHLAGRCIGCNECERVCPMEIPISLLNQKLAREVQAAFGHRAGIAPVPSPFVTILGGEESAS